MEVGSTVIFGLCTAHLHGLSLVDKDREIIKLQYSGYSSLKMCQTLNRSRLHDYSYVTIRLELSQLNVV